MKRNLARCTAFWCSALVLAGSGMAMADESSGLESIDLPEAQVILLGEVHDNAIHHNRQAAALKGVNPSAVVFEMLSADQAKILNDKDVATADLAVALDWAASGWPAFSLYQPVLEAARTSAVYGMAVSREDLMPVFEVGAVNSFGADADRFGLDQPLPAAEQAEREDAQFAAHCEALPRDMLAGMVAAQRFRDATFARTILRALEDTGGPVVAIAGNGHVRQDWGIPVYLAAAAPEVSVLSVGQIEHVDQPAEDLPYDVWLLSLPAEREDPCAVFAK